MSKQMHRLLQAFTSIIALAGVAISGCGDTSADLSDQKTNKEAIEKTSSTESIKLPDTTNLSCHACYVRCSSNGTGWTHKYFVGYSKSDCGGAGDTYCRKLSSSYDHHLSSCS